MDENLTVCPSRADPILGKTASNPLIERLVKSQGRDNDHKRYDDAQGYPPLSIYFFGFD